MRLLRLSVWVLLLSQFAGAQELERIVASMQAAQAKARASLRPYAATRDYTVRKSDDEKGAP
jgi:hypothetical protein